MTALDGEIFSKTKMSGIEWAGAIVLVLFAVGLCTVAWALWSDEGAWWIGGLALPFVFLALQTIAVIIWGPVYVVRISQGDLVIERRWLLWWTRRLLRISKRFANGLCVRCGVVSRRSRGASRSANAAVLPCSSSWQ